MTPDLKTRILVHCDSNAEIRRMSDMLRDWIRAVNPNHTVAVLNTTTIYAGSEMVEIIHSEKLAIKKQGARWDEIVSGSKMEEIIKRATQKGGN